MYFIQSIFGMFGTLIGAAAPPLASQVIQSYGGSIYNATLIQINGGINALTGAYNITTAEAAAISYNYAEDRGFFAVALFFACTYLIAMYLMVSRIYMFVCVCTYR